jgi:hypothetical protein
MKKSVGTFLFLFALATLPAMGQNLTVQLNPSSPSPNDFMFILPTNAGLSLGAYTNSSMKMNYKGSNSRYTKITVRKNPATTYPGIQMWLRAGLVTDDPNNPEFGISTDPVLVTDVAQTIIYNIRTPSNSRNKIRDIYITIEAIDYSLLSADRFNVNLIFEHVLQ